MQTHYDTGLLHCFPDYSDAGPQLSLNATTHEQIASLVDCHEFVQCAIQNTLQAPLLHGKTLVGSHVFVTLVQEDLSLVSASRTDTFAQQRLLMLFYQCPDQAQSWNLIQKPLSSSGQISWCRQFYEEQNQKLQKSMQQLDTSWIHAKAGFGADAAIEYSATFPLP